MDGFLNNISITRKIVLLMVITVIEFFIFTLYFFNSEEADYQSFRAVYITLISFFAMSAIVLSFNISKNITILIKNLNRQVDEKTSELIRLNLKLEAKVKEEVKKNREKDQIMYQHSRLAAMGEMVGNIAHQWRQPLNAMTVLIQSFAVKNMMGKLTDEFIEKQVEEGLRLSKMMSDTIDDFRNFFTPNKSREYFDVKECIKDTINLSQEKDIDITIKCEDNIKIYGYQNEFSQVVLNLLNNSIDSFNKSKIYDKHIFIEVKSLKESNQIYISFIDNGGGIDEAIIDRVFEPYFTTKHKSTGTGIGLYMSKQIIEKQMKGTLIAENITMNFDHVAYKCAKFSMTLPIAETFVNLQEQKLSVA